MRASPIAAILASACGRVGFDPLDATPVVPCVPVAQIDWASTPLPHDASAQVIPVRSYAIGAASVVDNVTQLVWQRDRAPTQLSWNDALTYCSTLVLDGCAAWRLPQRIELATLVDHDVISPSIATSAFPDTPFDANWWSATLSPASGDTWIVNFDNGNSFTDQVTLLDYVRCVRGGTLAQPPPARYATAAASVTDVETGLVWQRAVDPTQRVWDAAASYCATLALDGATWRLPTIIELQSIADTSRTTPRIDPTAFPATPTDVFWSSSLVNGDPTVVMVMSFADGTVNNAANTETHLARCVR
jgi:hypothetical protein